MKVQGQVCSIENLSTPRTMATVFALFFSVCPTVFSVEKGRQLGRELVVAELTNRYGESTAKSLLEQIRDMDIGRFTHQVAENIVTLVRPEGTYVFENLSHKNGAVSGLATMFDSHGEKLGEINLLNVGSPDKNRINFSAQVSDADGLNWTENGVLAGLGDGQAVSLGSINGEKTGLSLVDFKGMDVSTSTSSSPITVTTLGYSADDGVVTMSDSKSGGCSAVEQQSQAATVVGCVIIIVVVVAVVVLACAIFGWFC